MALKINWDALGITTSIVCAIHCAVLPLILTSLPIFGVNIVDNTSFEYSMIFLAVIVGCYALYHGYRRHHRNILPLIMFAFGALFLFGKEVWPILEILFLIPALISIVFAHYLNYRYCRKSKVYHQPHCTH